MAEQDAEAGAGDRRRSRRRSGAASDVDALAWQILSDLLTPDGAFAAFPPEGLQRLVEIRLEEEAAARGIPAGELGQAFERALRELTGKRAPREEAGGDV